MDRGRFNWGMVAVWCALFAGLLVLVRPVFAQIDTLECGYLACEQFIVDTNSCTPPPDATWWFEDCGCGERPDYPNLVGIISTRCNEVYGCSADPFNNTWNKCNCAAQPSLPASTRPSSESGLVCISGCTYEAEHPSVSFPDLQTGQRFTAASGWHPTGGNCNPVNPSGGPPPTDDPPDPNCDGDVCIGTEGDPPEFCGWYQGHKVCIDDPSDPCADADVAYLCVGDPPPDPPVDPDDPDKPDDDTPEVSGGPVVICSGSGACSTNTWEFHEDGGGSGDGGDGGGGGDDDDDDDDGDGGGGGSTGEFCDQHPDDPSCDGDGGDGEGPGVPGGTGHTPDCTANPAACEGDDDGDGHSAGGGTTCGSPPSCAGDPILCNMLHQSWAARCEAARSADALTPDAPGQSDYGTPVDGADAWGADASESPELDDAGWFGSRSCPELPTVSFQGATYDMASWIPCDILGILALMILLGGYAQAAYIIGRA